MGHQELHRLEGRGKGNIVMDLPTHSCQLQPLLSHPTPFGSGYVVAVNG